MPVTVIMIIITSMIVLIIKNNESSNDNNDEVTAIIEKSDTRYSERSPRQTLPEHSNTKATSSNEPEK